ncbi:class I SAM-dependent methyltransferase [Corynebacterium breve]|uniref:Class I SAM-dependent methyltransferase n=1 Tax=Corynebacterium breve TaxID=3049799 RepID=A0ABY8VFF7_9CORY|nr:class I SAM-dependent methyltransferase [Corynebacterium breve]WIM67495.1 class I SAM-dependent methyltransferase [Corynebacterium breve]
MLPWNIVNLPTTRRLATFARSIGLLRSFPLEQTLPDEFYGGLALDTARLLDAITTDVGGPALAGARVLDVGGGPGYFANEFDSRGAWYIGVEPDAGEMAAAGLSGFGAVRGDGAHLPFPDDTFDIVYSSNVVEHTPTPWEMGQDMIRVARPGGIVVICYTVWLGPFGGHETGLWQHYVGGEFARDRYTKKHGRPPKNVYGESLFDVSCTDGLRWATAAHDAELVAAFPRYHPSWAWWIVRIPVLREFLTSNLVLVLRKSA